MIDALKAAGGNPKYTEYAGAKHVIWVKGKSPDAYSERGLMDWVFSQKRGAKPAAASAAPSNSTATH